MTVITKIIEKKLGALLGCYITRKGDESFFKYEAIYDLAFPVH